MSALSIAEARANVLAACTPLESEDVPVADALDRILAEPLAAAHDVPPFRNSAMDGFALASGPAGRTFTIVDESRAGRPARRSPGAGEAVAISTGAIVPDGADAVVPIEQVEVHDSRVTVAVELRAHDNVRDAGEDMRADERLLEAGATLGPAELGAAVAAGRASLRCARRPRVSIVCSGDELRAPGDPLEPGQIHNSNAVTLAALARHGGAELVTVAAVPDRREETERALAQALERSDVLVISGGVSVGPHDHVKDALAAIGVEQRFWRVALRPGRPTWFGVRERRLAFGLPGNPVSAMVTFILFVRPALAALQGAPVRRPVRHATLAQPLPRHAGRDEAVRVRLVAGPAGLEAHSTGDQASHRLTSMLGADGLVVVERGEGEAPAGSPVEVMLI
jgi:molybdopterin molybdotransferase